jgi:hypothetical protein
MTVDELYKNKSFQNEKDQLIKNIIDGEYFPEVSIHREHISFLKRKLDQLENMTNEQIKFSKK